MCLSWSTFPLDLFHLTCPLSFIHIEAKKAAFLEGGGILSNAPGYLGIIPGGAWGNVWDDGNQTRLSCMQSNSLTCCSKSLQFHGCILKHYSWVIFYSLFALYFFWDVQNQTQKTHTCKAGAILLGNILSPATLTFYLLKYCWLFVLFLDLSYCI